MFPTELSKNCKLHWELRHSNSLKSTGFKTLIKLLQFGEYENNHLLFNLFVILTYFLNFYITSLGPKKRPKIDIPTNFHLWVKQENNLRESIKISIFFEVNLEEDFIKILYFKICYHWDRNKYVKRHQEHSQNGLHYAGNHSTLGLLTAVCID